MLDVGCSPISSLVNPLHISSNGLILSEGIFAISSKLNPPNFISGILNFSI
jgi:hypothetical protein